MDPQVIARWLPRLKRTAGMSAIVLVVFGMAGLAGTRLNPGPKQPIPFSHRLHAGQKEMSCFYCHPDADQAAYPGMPPVDKCLVCHQVIIPEFRPIQTLHAQKQINQGVPWKRVNVLPDFVFFNHQIHVARGFDCSQCHGDVKQMDRVRKSHRLDMGFCVDCHKRNGGSTDCWVCHR